MGKGLSQVVAGLVVLVGAVPALAGPNHFDGLMRWGGPRSDPIIDQQPHPYGGFGADTAARDDYGFPVWERTADDLLLAEPATIRRIVWWGFYGSTFGPYEEPPETETMRVRFYHVRLDDGLPDEENIAFEETFLDPSRTWTGRYVLTGGGGHQEFIFQTDVTLPVMLQQNVPYWLEIAQIGSPDSTFRWESGGTGPRPLAIININVSFWHYTQNRYNNAFQLWAVPEPSAGLLTLVGVVVLLVRRKSIGLGASGLEVLDVDVS